MKEDKRDKMAKGINKNVKNIAHEEYNMLIKKKQMRNKMKRIQSKSHQSGAEEGGKISLSCFDDKQYILNDEIKTLAYGHKCISLT